MIDKFQGDYAFLSNFYPAPFEYKGRIYLTAEHAYQAAKTKNEIEKEAIRKASTPGRAKRLGQKVTKLENWDSRKRAVMYRILIEKFSQNRTLKSLLIDTGYEPLVEGNYWGDTYWGVCKGEGQNHLGKLLMRVRAKIQLHKTNARE